ncbi:MAG: LysR substrate-binding domain-containing protein [Paracoccaceae bacterium]|nr:LysR substrate-binding domain-containing protein [Paracoccaceae bacterium]
MKRQLPPLPALRAFEAAARRGSFKDAAEELGVTPTAVSYQIKRLEEQLGAALFERRVRQVDLTSTGEALHLATAQALDRIENEWARLRHDRSTVVLLIGPMAAGRWLVPRMTDFWKENPRIDLRLHHSARTYNLEAADADLAIAYGEGKWPQYTVEPLIQVEMTPVVSPTLLDETGPVGGADDLMRLPLIHERDRQDWDRWIAENCSAGTSPKTDIMIQDANVALHAAINGQGVALGIIQFIHDDLAAGRLVRPVETTVRPTRAYYLLTRPNWPMNPAMRRVYEWLKQAAG